MRFDSFRSLAAWGFATLFVLGQLSTCGLSQSSIPLDVELNPVFDGEATAQESLTAQLYDGFTYRIPFSMTCKGKHKFVDIQGRTQCKCASLRVKKFTPGEETSTVEGEIYVYPQGTDIFQDVEAYGLLPGDERPIKILRVSLNCRVFPPLALRPSPIEAKEGKLTTSTLRVETLDGVEILHASLSDSESRIESKYDKVKRSFTLTNADDLKVDSLGYLTAEFRLRYGEAEASFFRTLRYGPPYRKRVIPSEVSLDTSPKDDRTLLGRLFLLGVGAGDSKVPAIEVERLTVDGKWVKLEGKIEFEGFDNGQALCNLTIPKKHVALDWPYLTQLRIRDEETKSPLFEFGIKIPKTYFVDEVDGAVSPK
jgi:hypothetical protein